MALCCVLEQDIFQFLSPHRYIHVNEFQSREFNMLGIDNSAINYTVASYPGGVEIQSLHALGHFVLHKLMIRAWVH